MAGAKDTSTQDKEYDLDAAIDQACAALNRVMSTNWETCVHCGLCADSCHFYRATGDPRDVPAWKVEQFRKVLRAYHSLPAKIFPKWFGARALDQEFIDELVDIAFGGCTMCRRCTFNCPLGIDNATIIRAARTVLGRAGAVPEDLLATATTSAETGNNMDISVEDFVDTIEWLEEELQDEVDDPDARIPVDQEGIDVYYTVNPREPKFMPLTISAVAKIFYYAGENWGMSSKGFEGTNYGLFTGDNAVANKIAHNVLDEAKRLGAKRVVSTECGHGFRALRWEAENWMGEQMPFEIFNVMELMVDYVKSGRIKLDPAKNPDRVTYHDPCNLTRSCGIVEEPRFLLRRSVSNFVEMGPHGIENFCCGGGGGMIGMSRFSKRRIEVSGKVKAEQIKATGAKIVATACHNCVDQLSELNRHYKLGVKITTVGELVAEALIVP